MANERFELRIPIFKLIIGALLTIVPISVVGLYSLNHSQSALEKTLGSHFRTIAEFAASEVAQFVHDRVTSVATLAAEPNIVEAVEAANRGDSGISDTAFAERVQKTEKIWNTPQASGMVNSLLSSRASQLLRRYRDLDRRFLRITVTDEKGSVVAATHKTLDYYQGDEDFWQKIYAQGRGAASLTDVLYDDVTKSYYIGVGLPIADPSSNRFVGAIDALLEVSTIFPIVQRAQLGPTGVTQIVKEDGTVIGSQHANLAMKLKSDEYVSIQDLLGTLSGRQAGFLSSPMRAGGPRLIAFADTGLKRDYGSLGWIVIVSQETAEALAPVRMVTRLVAFMAIVGLIAVTFLIAYFSLHRERKVVDIRQVVEKPELPVG
ncbi:MAG: cache domain-containing protein [Bryobacteraceae bacterium]